MVEIRKWLHGWSYPFYSPSKTPDMAVWIPAGCRGNQEHSCRVVSYTSLIPSVGNITKVCGDRWQEIGAEGRKVRKIYRFIQYKPIKILSFPQITFDYSASKE